MAIQTSSQRIRGIDWQGSNADALRILEAAGADMSVTDRAYFREELDRIRDQLSADRNPAEGFATMFHMFVEKELEATRKETGGGRPPDTALATAMHALADLYIQVMGGHIDIWKVPAGQNSYFPRFAAAALAPLYNDPDGRHVPALAKFWYRERKKMKPLNDFQDSEVLSSAE